MHGLSDWFKANKLSLNVKKSNYVIFKPKQRREEFDLNIEIIMVIRWSALRKLLFLVLFWMKTFHGNHISHIDGKIFKSVGIIGRSSPCVTTLALKTLYYSLVYPYFQCCIIVWGLYTLLTLIVLFCYKSVLLELLIRSLLTHILIHCLEIQNSWSLYILNLCIPAIITYLLPLLAIFFFVRIRFIAIILMVLTDLISHFARKEIFHHLPRSSFL